MFVGSSPEERELAGEIGWNPFKWVGKIFRSKPKTYGPGSQVEIHTSGSSRLPSGHPKRFSATIMIFTNPAKHKSMTMGPASHGPSREEATQAAVALAGKKGWNIRAVRDY